jgi:hypothetical protein
MPAVSPHQPAREPHSIQVHEEDGRARAELRGDLDVTTILALRAVVRGATARTRNLTLDCRDVTTTNVAQARALRLFLDQEIEGCGIALSILPPRAAAARRALAAAKLDGHFGSWD